LQNDYAAERMVDAKKKIFFAGRYRALLLLRIYLSSAAQTAEKMSATAARFTNNRNGAIPSWGAHACSMLVSTFCGNELFHKGVPAAVARWGSGESSLSQNATNSALEACAPQNTCAAPLARQNEK